MECKVEILLERVVKNLSVPVHCGLALVAFGAFHMSKTVLDASYVRSGHPVDYATGQLAFDGEKIAGYYQNMIAGGTLDIYWQTQVIDFAFIASVLCLSVLLGTLIARIGPDGSWGRALGFAAAWAGAGGALFDAVENLLSFAMLADPQGIPQALAIAYSSAAAAKFGLLTAAMGLLCLSAVFGVVRRIILRAVPQSSAR